jgi:hypothetical protein
MLQNKVFLKNEGLAKKVMDILMNNFDVNISVTDTTINYNALDLIKWSIEDYESCGFNMKSYRGYYNLLKKQQDRRLNKLGGKN